MSSRRVPVSCRWVPSVIAEAAGERQLYWTARDRPVPCQLVPVLSGWDDLDQREDAADVGPGQPILIDPEFRLDRLLARFLGGSRFAWLAEGTRQAYAKDYRVFSPSCGSAAGTGTRPAPTTCWTGKPGGGAASGAEGSAAASGSASWRPCGWSTSGPRKSSTSRAARSSTCAFARGVTLCMAIGRGLAGRPATMINFFRTDEQTWSNHGPETAIDQGKGMVKTPVQGVRSGVGAPPGT